ncbi:tryptophan--tRNA ligase [Rickettsiales endosymbiont of Stachyamoeba lipophora]|uniref:tryptophan--tRNA ligase n=1 Tax=Rickettsiales endosymbiont of Stachyamoeba lipophora TaxID=2486578 RepID=UPI000F65602A|nr:tryptophan--tRNA ligase [Rickettsiales endosymbiont of Stachyamoeba lipophora]AZL15407.1 tryptophan--tRNA ligase [Rickettsiales endosymbiont of Stachyamoeba lipophora]
MSEQVTRILSGITTTGRLHLGNYLGAIKNWTKLQMHAETFLFVADLHAITTDQDPDELKRNILNAVITYLACGIDPEQACIFVQSQNPHHAELAWILSCVARIGWLNRMTQFKDKSGKNKDNAYVGLYTYPVLMAADILLYHPTHVPVGDDQKQHLELARDIAQSLNRKFERSILTVPEPYIVGEATRIMSLRDATKKMSKSDESDYSRINLDDDEDAIIKKIKKAKSDSEAISLATLGARPELNNLATIYAACTDSTKTRVIEQFEGKGFAEFKSALYEVVVNKIVPIANEIKYLRNHLDHVQAIVTQGNSKAAELSVKTLAEVKQAFGLKVF